MVLSYISTCTVPYADIQKETYLLFLQTISSVQLFQHTLSFLCFFLQTLQKYVSWTPFFQDVCHVEKTFKYTNSVSESESRNFDSMKFGLDSFQRQPVFSSSKTNLPFIKTNKRYIHKYSCIYSCSQHVSHFQRMQQNVNNFRGKKARRKREKGRDLIQSYYKSPYTQKNPTSNVTTQKNHQQFR